MTNASGIQDGWALAGTITVSGTGTDLGSNAITSWTWTVTKGISSNTYSSTDSGAYTNAQGLLATPTQLIVQYASGGAMDSNALELVARGGSVKLQWWTGVPMELVDARYSAYDLPTYYWAKQNPTFPSTTPAGWVIGTAGSAAVPEIDPAGIGSVLALVTGALGLLERRRLKTA
jgi:hypothetical protein